ncbi:MAG: hypothetical protein ACYS6K_27025, partial [Planctomycetota bacterium]
GLRGTGARCRYPESLRVRCIRRLARGREASPCRKWPGLYLAESRSPIRPKESQGYASDGGPDTEAAPGPAGQQLSCAKVSGKVGSLECQKEVKK